MRSLIFVSIFLSSVFCFAKSDYSQIKFTEFTPTPLATAKAIKYSELKGKVVLIDFWASWCEPCKEALPHYDKLLKKYKSKPLVILGVNEDDSVSERDAFIKANKYSIAFYYDQDRSFAKVFNVSALPTLFILNKKTEIIASLRGFDKDSAAELDKKIETLLKEK